MPATLLVRFALDAVREEFDIPILGVIEAGAKVAAQVTRNKRVGVIATEGTIESGTHAKVLKQIDPEITVIRQALSLVCSSCRRGMDTRSSDSGGCQQISERASGKGY